VVAAVVAMIEWWKAVILEMLALEVGWSAHLV